MTAAVYARKRCRKLSLSRVSIAVLLLALISGSAGCTKSPPPAANETRYTIYGQGSQSCGSWTTASGIDETVKEVWVIGFISGAGWTGYKMRETDLQGIAAAMDRHCEQSPADTIAEGAAAVAEQLRERSTR